VAAPKKIDASEIERERVGLCADCIFARRIESAKGSHFILCERSFTDPAFPKYPQLPVMECAGYSPESVTRPQP
jgi:hypothetical protein